MGTYSCDFKSREEVKEGKEESSKPKKRSRLKVGGKANSGLLKELFETRKVGVGSAVSQSEASKRNAWGDLVIRLGLHQHQGERLQVTKSFSRGNHFCAAGNPGRGGLGKKGRSRFLHLVDRKKSTKKKEGKGMIDRRTGKKENRDRPVLDNTKTKT